MTMLRPLSEMRDSGIQWIGNIPVGWRVVPLLALLDGLDAMRDGPFGSDLKNEEYTDSGVPVVQLGAIQDGKFEERKLHFITETKADSLIRHNALPHDVVIAKMMPAGKAAILPEKYDRYVVSADVIKATITKDYWSRWLIYALNSYGVIQCEIQSQGATRARININKAKRIKIAIPNDIDIPSILNYLDDRCSKIDETIAEAENSIEEYKELKQAVIFEAVTKGLDKNVAMKDSGVEWIGKMPSTWNAIRIKYLLSEMNNRSESGEEEPLSVSQVLGVVPSSLIAVANPASSTIGQKIVEPGELVFNKLKAHLGVFFVSNYKGLVSPDYAVYRANDKVNPKFLEYLFHTSACITEFKKYITGVAVGLMRLYTSDLFNIYVALPKRSEQERIIKHLNESVHKYDDLISEKQALIEDLQAYRKSLIYEVVTGKRRVV